LAAWSRAGYLTPSRNGSKAFSENQKLFSMQSPALQKSLLYRR